MGKTEQKELRIEKGACPLFLCLLTPFLLILTFPFSNCCGEEAIPVDIEAEELHYFEEKGLIVAEGAVRVTAEEVTLTAQRAKLNLREDTILAEGEVVLTREGEQLQGKSILYSFSTGRAKIEDFQTYLEPWFVRGEMTEGLGEKEYHIGKGMITSCDLLPPHYHLKVDRIEVVTGESIKAYNCVFYLGRMPLFYLPVYRRSLRDERGGFIMTGGHNSKEGWFGLSRYQWYLEPNLQGRIYLDYFERLGVGGGLDFTYRPMDKEDTSSFFYGYYIDEKEVVWDEDDDEYRNPPHAGRIDRWKMHLRQRWRIGADTLEIIRIDSFSDADFNDDYEDEEIWRRWKRSDLEDQDPEGSFSITKARSKYHLGFYLRKRVNDFLDVTEELPRFYFDLKEQKLGNSSLYGDLNADAVYLHQAPEGEEASQIGSLLRLGRPGRIGWLRLEPAISYQNYWYSRDEEGDSDIWQGNYTASLGLSTRLYKMGNGKCWRHILQPRIIYSHVGEPAGDDEELYDFCSQVEGEEDYFSLQLINRLQRKQNGQGKDLARFVLDTRYYPDSDDNEGDSWSDIDAELDLDLTDRLTVSAEASYDPDRREFEVFDTDLAVSGKKWGIHLGTKYYEPEGEEETFDLAGGFTCQLGPKWSLSLYDRYDLNENFSEEWGIALYRDLHCWEGRLIVQGENQEEGDDEITFYLVFSLKALPGVELSTGRMVGL